MSLVGEVLISARELMTDLPQVQVPPTAVSATPTTGGTLSPSTQYFLVVTETNNFGETAISAELNATLGGGQTALSVVVHFPAGSVNTIRIYYGLSTGSYIFYQEFSGAALVSPFILTGVGSVVASSPTRSTAYLPDTDGQSVGAFALYRWFNQALAWAAAKNRGGLPDFGAVGTTDGQPVYVMPGYWKKIDTAWFDGYPLGLLNKSSVFRRQPVPGNVGCLIVYQATDRLIVECWPQPDRTSGQSTLASPMLVTDTTAVLTSNSGIVLGFGLFKIGSEIVEFASISGSTLSGLTRGMCGTTPSAHSAGEATTELNLMISGFRVPSTYSVGQANTTLYLPPGWDEALVSYILYRFRSAEQDDKAAQRYLQEATQKMSDLSANRIIAGPRQINPGGNRGPEVAAGMGSVFGGVIIP